MKIDYTTFFTDWKNWETFEERRDAINGVYAFRLKSSFGRVKGQSSILYFGKSEQDASKNKRPGIWHRLMNYRQRNAGASKRLKEIENEYGGRSSIEYAYEICENPREVENLLLEDYYSKHLEFPPLNRNA